MTSWIGRSHVKALGSLAIVSVWIMSVSIPALAVYQPLAKPMSGLTRTTQQYRAYVMHVAPLFNALHQAETMLGTPENLTLQRWSAWLGGWDGYYQEVIQQAKEARFGNVRRYNSYRQLEQTHAVLHQVQQRMQQQYLGLPSNPEANAGVMDRAYQQVQHCLEIEDTLQPLLLSSAKNQTGRR